MHHSKTTHLASSHGEGPPRRGRSRALLRAGVCLAVLLLIGARPALVAAIDLKEDFANLRERDYFLRVGLAENADAARLVSQGEFYLHDRYGKVLYQGQGGEPLRFTVRDATPAQPIYYYLLDVFTSDDRATAEAQAKRAGDVLNRDVRVIKDPRRDYSPSPVNGGPPAADWVTAVGPYTSERAAKRDESLIERNFSPVLVESWTAEAKGRVEVRDGGGNLVAHAPDYIGMRPRRRSHLIRAAALSLNDKRWSDPSAYSRSRAYRGLMEIWVNPKGRLSIINRVFIEHYLYGVVAVEIGPQAPFETKKAQAVISRSIALRKLRQRRHISWHYDLCDEQHCQVYYGALEEDAECNAAVDATWGQVATCNNEVIDAVYSVCCGGVTASSNHVWNGPPCQYLTSTLDGPGSATGRDFSNVAAVQNFLNSYPDVFCNSRQAGYPNYAKKYFRWQRTFSSREVARLLKAAGHSSVDRVTNIAVGHRISSGRVDQLRFTTDEGVVTVQGENEIRRALGGLYSSFFTLDRGYKGNVLSSVTFKGGGYGHGVGLCQMGAMMMARRGYNYLEILKHYYRGVEIYRIYR